MPKYEEYIDFIMRMPAWDPPVKHSLTSHDECKSEQSKSLGAAGIAMVALAFHCSWEQDTFAVSRPHRAGP